MTEVEQDGAADLSLRDPDFVAKVLPFLRLVMKTYFRSEVRGIERVPAEGGVLIVSNHSGGLMPMDVPIIAVAFDEHFGSDRPIYTLAHDMLFTGAAGPVMRKAGWSSSGASVGGWSITSNSARTAISALLRSRLRRARRFAGSLASRNAVMKEKKAPGVAPFTIVA